MDYQLDSGGRGGPKLGAIVLSTDETLEADARQVIEGRKVDLMHARIASLADVTPETLGTMANDMTATAALLPQGLKAIAYACTSGATVIGPEKVQNLVQEAHPGVPVTNPMSAVIAALHHLGVTRIAMVTPYVASVTAPMRAHLSDNGIEVVSEVSFGEGDDRKVARITEASTSAAMAQAAQTEGVQAIFASCTNLRTFGIIDTVEADLGIPVVSSNQALLWHLLKLSGIEAAGWGPGQLFS